LLKQRHQHFVRTSTSVDKLQQQQQRIKPAAVNDIDIATKDVLDLSTLFLPPVLELPHHKSKEDPLPGLLQTAEQLRTCIKHRCQHGEAVCAVCGRYLPLLTKGAGKAQEQATWDSMPVLEIPHLQLLAANGPKTEEMPRHALTTVTIDGAVYCLEPAGITVPPGEAMAASALPQHRTSVAYWAPALQHTTEYSTGSRCLLVTQNPYRPATYPAHKPLHCYHHLLPAAHR
jgi:hypothetical protein